MFTSALDINKEFQKARNEKKEQAKLVLKSKKQGKKNKKEGKTKYIKKADTIWSEIVKLRAGRKCEYCGTTIKRLNSHHLFTRSKKITRWDLDNGICLCAGHHTLSSTFSAHMTPLEFSDRVKEYKGMDWYDKMKVKSNKTFNYSVDELKSIIEQLKEERKLQLKELEKAKL